MIDTTMWVTIRRNIHTGEEFIDTETFALSWIHYSLYRRNGAGRWVFVENLGGHFRYQPHLLTLSELRQQGK